MDLQIHKIKTVLKEQLKKNKITYEHLAEELQVSVPTIKRWMGDADIGLSDLIRICEVLNLNLAELYALTEKLKGHSGDNTLTDEQQKFLAKNPNFFAYYLKILDGQTPEQIAEKYKLTKLSTDKYLLRLEKLELIKVTGKLKVKSTISGNPNLGYGALAKTYYRQIVNSSGAFFIDSIAEAISHEHLELKDRHSTTYGIQRIRVSKESYEKWVQENWNNLNKLAAIGEIEEKAYEEQDLLNAVIINAHCAVPSDYPALQRIDEAFGKIENL